MFPHSSRLRGLDYKALLEYLNNLLGHNRKLVPLKWKSGERIWIMDMLFPFGGTELAIKEIKEMVFPGKTVKTLNVDASGRLKAETV